MKEWSLSAQDDCLKLSECFTIGVVKFNIDKTFQNNFYFAPAIYCLLRKNHIVYIGETNCLISRIAKHYQDGEKEFDGFRILKIGVSCEIERKNIEQEYIRKLKPFYNTHYKNKSSYTDAEIERYIDKRIRIKLNKNERLVNS